MPRRPAPRPCNKRACYSIYPGPRLNPRTLSLFPCVSPKLSPYHVRKNRYIWDFRYPYDIVCSALLKLESWSLIGYGHSSWESSTGYSKVYWAIHSARSGTVNSVQWFLFFSLIAGYYIASPIHSLTRCCPALPLIYLIIIMGLGDLRDDPPTHHLPPI